MYFIYLFSPWFILNILLINLQVENPSTIIIYQKSSYILQKFDIIVNDKKLDINFTNKTSLELKVNSGKIKIVTKGKRFLADINEYVIDVKDNETYFLEAYIDYDFSTINLKLRFSNSKKYFKLEPKLKKIILDESLQPKQ